MTYSQLTYQTYRQPVVTVPTWSVSAAWAKHKDTIGDFAGAVIVFIVPMLLLFI